MNAVHSKIQRPQRWDQSFDPDLTDQDVQWLLTQEPFRSMNEAETASATPLRGILAHDCRLLNLQKGDIIVREGDYGNSAFLIFSGEALVSLKRLSAEILGRESSKKKNWFTALSQLWSNSKLAEVRNYTDDAITANKDIGKRDDHEGTHVFLHDIPSVIPADKMVKLKEGEIFGELSALMRSPRSATVVANSPMKLLEVRWQGFRDLMKRNTSLREHIEKIYRENSLQSQLRQTPLLQHLSPEQIKFVAEQTVFESTGRFQWNADYRSIQKKDISERILSEPVIAKQGDYPNGLLLVRNGFARMSRRHGDGEQTVTYLGKGQVFGFRELAHNWRTKEQRSWMLSLRAVGYVDILRIPVNVVEDVILPSIPPDQFPPPMSPQESGAKKRNNKTKRIGGERRQQLDRGLMEFLVEKRYINGAKAMMIDLDRCTRCDDCIRACAATHNNNPRFVRHGEIHDHWMIASACMHCADPVCMIGCPTGAIARDMKTGNVTINDKTCIGCATCANSCPYENIRMVSINDRKGQPIVDQTTGDSIMKATKCDFCIDQLGGPACQRACPHDALVRIDLTTPGEMTSWSQRNE